MVELMRKSSHILFVCTLLACLRDLSTQEGSFFCRIVTHNKLVQNPELLGTRQGYVPARSPDLNPIENIFHIVRRKLHYDALELVITRDDFESFSARVKRKLYAGSCTKGYSEQNYLFNEQENRTHSNTKKNRKSDIEFCQVLLKHTKKRLLRAKISSFQQKVRCYYFDRT